MVDRRQCREIEHLATHAFALQRVGGAQCFGHHRAPGYDRDIGAFAQAITNVERQCLPVIRYFLFHQSVQASGLEEDDRVGIADRRKQ